MKFIKVQAYPTGSSGPQQEILVNVEAVTWARESTFYPEYEKECPCVYVSTIGRDFPLIVGTLAELEAKIAEACK